MNTRIYNARILQTENDKISIIQGEVCIKDGIIVYVGNENKSTGITVDNESIIWDKEIDAQNNLIMPGFKNAHTHSAMTLMRSYADDLPLQQWLYNKIFPMEANLTADYVYWGSRLAILEYLTSGITANFDMYMQNDANLKASIDSGFRTVLCDSINDFGGTVEQVENDYLRFNKATNPEQSDLVSYKIGFHAEYTTKRELMEELSALAHKYKAKVYVHNSETKKEVEECKERYGLTPTGIMNKLGLYDFGGGAYHGVYLTDEDIDIYKEKGVYVVTNPSSNLKLASGIAQTQKLLDRGIKVAIGTDGPASNNCLDMFREMFLVTGLQKYILEDASACNADDVLLMAIKNGAFAMELDCASDIAVGKCADLIMIDLNQPNMQPIHNISKNLVYSGSKQNVVMTMVNGRILYDHGTFNVGVEPEEIYAKCNECAQAMIKATSGK